MPYLKSVLGFLGMTDVEVLEVEGTAFGPDAAEKAVAAATAKLHAHCEQRTAARRRERANKKRRRTMRFCHDELTLDEMLNDPLIGAVMRADGVDPDELGAEFARMARRSRKRSWPSLPDLPLTATALPAEEARSGAHRPG